MLTKFFTTRISLTSEIFASFVKRRPNYRSEPCYYTPLPQATPQHKMMQNQIARRQKFDRYSVHPHSFWLTQGKGTERPFTGKYWDTKTLGHYNCIVCHQKLFISDNKYQTPLGVATFWNTVKFSVKLEDDIEELKTDKVNLTTRLYDKETDEEQKPQRVCCSKCSSHLGTLHHDGPPPTFQRYTINSGALDFSEKPWFHPPQYYRQELIAYKRVKRRTDRRIRQKKRKISRTFKMNNKQFQKIQEQSNLPLDSPLIQEVAEERKRKEQEQAEALQKATEAAAAAKAAAKAAARAALKAK